VELVEHGEVGTPSPRPEPVGLRAASAGKRPRGPTRPS